uniref:DNA polymerase n=1 Tax=Pithovirus LCDPAC01 TaxID=2506600 RepID=A0A481YNE4_9VIRU|nr:MAG: DNA polymerase elongation subunit family B [Pithovirus LCDPAC01]
MDILHAQPYKWIGGDIDNLYCIRLWSHTKGPLSKRVLIKIVGYKPFVRIKMPKANWKIKYLRIYRDWVSKVLKDHAQVESKFKYCKDINGYTEEKDLIVYFYFDSEEAMKHCTNLLKKPRNIWGLGKINAVPVETRMNSMTKFLVEKKVRYTQWLSIKAVKTMKCEKISSLREEYTLNLDDKKCEFNGMSQSETEGWKTNPVVMAIDIECYSQNHNKFPNAFFALDEAYMISVIIKRLDDSKIKKILLVTKPCSEIKGAEVHVKKDEIEAIHELSDLALQYDTSLIVGYNTFGFDVPYMNNRLEIHGKKWKSMSPIIDDETTVYTQEWESSAYKFVSINTIKAEGIINVDMLPVIKRNNRFGSYKLDFVSKHFLGRGKHPVTAKEMFRIYDRGDAKEMAKVGAYCLEDANLCIDLMEKLETWIMLTEMSSITRVGIEEIYTRGQQLRVYNQVYNYSYHENFYISKNDNKYKRFIGATVVTPKLGRHENIITLDFASLYPSIIIAMNICYTTIVRDPNFPDHKCVTHEWEDVEGEKRSCRFIKKEYFEGILPRMCKELIDVRRKTKARMKASSSSTVKIILNARQKALKVSANSIYGSLNPRNGGKLQLSEGASIVTCTGRNLIKRSIEIAAEKYDANTVYGDTDSIMVDLKIRDEKMANTVCAKLGIEIKKGEKLGLILKRIGMALSKGITCEFPAHINLEFEEVAAIFFSISKKYYAKILYDKQGNVDYKNTTKKGVVSVRRDNCKWIRDIYDDVLNLILIKGTLKDCIAAIDQRIIQLVTRGVPLSSFILTGSIGSSYKEGSTFFIKTFYDEMKRIGRPVARGERIEYVIVTSKNPTKNHLVGLKMRFLDMYLDGDEKIDYAHYVRKATNSIEKLLGLVYSDQIKPYKGKRGVIPTRITNKYVKYWEKFVIKKAEIFKDLCDRKNRERLTETENLRKIQLRKRKALHEIYSGVKRSILQQAESRMDSQKNA